MVFAKCVDCDQEIGIGSNPKLGRYVECKNCRAEQEIININPPRLGWLSYDDNDEADEWAPRSRKAYSDLRSKIA